MTMQRLPILNFQGGMSDDEKFGPNNSYSNSPAIDFRASPGLMRLQRKTQKESGTTITTEIRDMARVAQNGGDVYMAGGTKIYKRTVGSNGAAGSYAVSSSNAALRNVQDLDYRPDVDALFLYDNTSIHELSPLSNSPVYTYDKYAAYPSTSTVNSGGAYVLPSAINEAQAMPVTYTAEPVFSVTLNVASKGTGDWTVTLHDGSNRVIGTATVLAANVPASGPIEFIFPASLRAKLGLSYHYHVTSSNATGTITSNSSNTLGNASVIHKAQRLVDAGSFGHAVIQAGPKSFICNEHYLAEWEILDTTAGATAGYNAHKLVFPAECISMNVANYNEYIAVGCAINRGTDGANNSPTQGIIFFWDGASPLYQFALEVPQGAPNSLHAQDNTLYWEAGGRWYRWAGGDIELLFEFPGVDGFAAASNGPNVDLYLKAGRKCATSRGGLLLMGFPYASANPNVNVGVFSFGASKGYGSSAYGPNYQPKAVGYDFLISTGSKTPNFDTGPTPNVPVTGVTCLNSFGTNLLIAWKDYIGGATVYGVDYVNDNSPYASAASWESLWFDNGVPDKQKSADVVRVTFKPLKAGITIIPKYRFDRNSAWITQAGVQAGQGDTFVRMTPPNQASRFYESMFGFDVTSANGFTPEIVSAVFKFDDLVEEDNDT